MEARSWGDPDRARRLIAPAIGGLALVLSLIGTAASLAASREAVDRTVLLAWDDRIERAAFVVLQVDLALLLAVATLICVRLPAHPVGWLLLASGTVFAIAVGATGYVLVAFAGGPTRLPAAAPMAFVYNWSWSLAFACLSTALFLFPTGRSVSTAWRRGFGVVLAALLGATVVNAAYPGPMPQSLGVDNPVALSALADVDPAVVQGAFGVSVVSMLAVAACSMVARYRRSRPTEQLQLRWVAGASTVIAATLALLAARGPWDAVDDLIMYLTLATLPLAIGIAILRYHLYAIDVIIRRTLVYGALSITLAGCYGLTVLVLQPLLTGFVGEDWLVVATATLLVAVAFRPMRSWIQRVIDRRFFRVRYDAAQTATDLASRLRGEVELDVIEADLVATVTETMQPSRIGFWERS
jgi:hypothetical protein